MLRNKPSSYTLVPCKKTGHPQYSSLSKQPVIHRTKIRLLLLGLFLGAAPRKDWTRVKCFLVGKYKTTLGVALFHRSSDCPSWSIAWALLPSPARAGNWEDFGNSPGRILMKYHILCFSVVTCLCPEGWGGVCRLGKTRWKEKGILSRDLIQIPTYIGRLCDETSSKTIYNLKACKLIYFVCSHCLLGLKAEDMQEFITKQWDFREIQTFFKVHKKNDNVVEWEREEYICKSFCGGEFACKAVRKDKQMISAGFKECVLAFWWDGCGVK